MITGSNGFVGRHLSNFYQNAICVNRQTADLCNEEDVKTLFSIHQPDVIIHTAANSNPNPSKDNTLQMYKNLQITSNIVKWMPKHCHIIHLSSSLVYDTILVDQKQQVNELSSTNSEFVYGQIKRTCEQVIETCQNYTNIRLCAVVGLNMTHGLLPKLIKQIKESYSGAGISLLGQFPGTIQQYLHIDDLISAIEYIISKDIYGTYNVCPDELLSLFDVIEILKHKFKKDNQIKWIPNDEFYMQNFYRDMSSNKLRLHGWKTKYTSQHSIESIG